MRLRIDDAVGEGVVGGAPAVLVPAGRRFGAEAKRERQLRPEAEDVFRIPCAEQRAPVHLRRSRIKKECAYCAAQKLREAGESGLAELAERDGFVGLKTRQPCAQTELIPAMGWPDPIFVGEEI